MYKAPDLDEREALRVRGLRASWRSRLSLPTSRYRALIDAAAGVAGLPYWETPQAPLGPGVWLEGLVLTESSGNPKARRYEKHQDTPGRKDSASDADSPLVDDGDLEDDASYGLAQVMGTNVRRLVGVAPGVPMRFGFVFLPMMGLALGLRVLAEDLAAVQGDVPRALCRYNGGPTGTSLVPGPGGQLVYRRQEYVDKVHANALRALEDRRL